MFQSTLFSRVFFFLVRSISPDASVIERLAYWQTATDNLAEWFKTDYAVELIKRSSASVYSAFVEHFAAFTGDVKGVINGELNNAGNIVMEERQALAGTAKGFFLALCNGAMMRDLLSEETASKRKKAKNPFNTDNGAQYTVELTGENGKGEAALSVAYVDNGNVIVNWFRQIYAVITLSNGEDLNACETEEVLKVRAEKRKECRQILDNLEIVPAVFSEHNEQSFIPTLELTDKAYAMARAKQQTKALLSEISKAQFNEKATTHDKLSIICNAQELKDYETARATYWQLRAKGEDQAEIDARALLNRMIDTVKDYCQRTYKNGKTETKVFQSIAVTWEAEYNKQARIKKNLKAKPAYDYGTDKEASFENDVLRYMKNYGVAREVAESVVSVHNKKNNVTYETATV